jgi:hypothetical protein
MAADSPDAQQEWEAYAKDRYESRRGSLVEYRGWARQLMQVMAVVIALEITLFGRQVGDAAALSLWYLLPVLVLLSTITYQITLLDLARGAGYNLCVFRHPAAPRDIPVGDSVHETRRRIAAEYSRAYDERDAESAAVGHRVKELGAALALSLLRGLLLAISLMFLVICIVGGETSRLPGLP